MTNKETAERVKWTINRYCSCNVPSEHRDAMQRDITDFLTTAQTELARAMIETVKAKRDEWQAEYAARDKDNEWVERTRIDGKVDACDELLALLK